MAPELEKEAIRQSNQSVRGATLHLRRVGHGAPLVLLHGWPEFSLTWEPVMQRLARRFDLVAPDLRGFGDSDKPEGLFGAEDQARDVLALADALGLERFGLVGHDVGGAVLQAMARLAPERMTGLFLFGFSHRGIGGRASTPDRLGEVWYQSFHQMDLAEVLVGATRETVRAYITHFLHHWSHRKDAFEDVENAWVENFLNPAISAAALRTIERPQRSGLL